MLHINLESGDETLAVLLCFDHTVAVRLSKVNQHPSSQSE